MQGSTLGTETRPSLKIDGIRIRGAQTPGYWDILTVGALRFVAELQRQFEPRRLKILQERLDRRRAIDAGQFPDFPAETKPIREAAWRVAPIPDDLRDRRVEITGPVERKMMINALNSDARVFMADFEDSNSPTWANTIQGQLNLRDAVAGTLTYESPEGKRYELQPQHATLMVRPRGWHLIEKHVLIDEQPASAALFDFGLFFYHNAQALIERGTGPYFYLPKMESRFEARLWNEVFNFAQDKLGIPRGSIRATVLIETLPAAFEMEEILYELREHSAGLNCGRWDYIFSFIKTFRNRPEFVLPDRAQITMEQHFLTSYVERLIQICHRRGIHAMGGMAAQIPVKNDPERNAAAMEKVRRDKLREVTAGHDGTWVAHPGLIAIAQEVFDFQMPGRDQISNLREDVSVTAQDLLTVPKGEITERGLRGNVRIAIQYLESWLRSSGCVALNNIMEDAATAEISRTQVWQWLRHGVKLADGRLVTVELVRTVIAEELAKIRETVGAEVYEQGAYELSARLFEEITTAQECPEFLTTMAYEYLD